MNLELLEHRSMKVQFLRGAVKISNAFDRIFPILHFVKDWHSANCLSPQRKEKALEIAELSKGERKVEETIRPTEEELDVAEKKLAQLSEEDLSAQRRVRDSLNRLSNAVDNARKLEHQVSYRFLSLI